MTSAGTVLGSPIVVCNATNDQINPRIASDAANGAVLAWVDKRGGNPTFPDIFSQRVRAGSPYFTCWTANGVLVLSGVLSNPGLSIAGDGAGGADIAASSNDIAARHIINTGALNGAALLCFASGVQNFTSAVVTGANTAIVSWWDGRNSLEGVYANQHTFSGPGADPCPPAVGIEDGPALPSKTEFSSPSPNPTSEDALFRFGVPHAEAGHRYELGIFDISGRRVRMISSGNATAGRFSLMWDLRDDAGQAVRSGLYIARFWIGDRTETRSVLVRR